MMRIQDAIAGLEYVGSANLYTFDSCADLSTHSLRKIFSELNLAAIYMADDKPLIAFYESANPKLPKELCVKIWNAQIPLVIVNFESHIEVYNGCCLEEAQRLILLDTISENEIDGQSPFSFWNITDPAFWIPYEKKLQKPTLDMILFDNIRAATARLRQTNAAPFAVKIILRMIFIRYLIDRGVDLAYKGLSGDVGKSQSLLLEIIRDKMELYDLFAYLKERFNGNLFELYENVHFSESELLDDSGMRILHDLMTGEQVMSTGQMSLFPLYDFNIIPVELISNIYERFLSAEQQKSDKAFYTPPYLVDYLLNQTVFPHIQEGHSTALLDPACGSGIFLVLAARQIIERSVSIEGNRDVCDQTLVNAVTQCLWGVDKNAEAVDVAIFSLYLTILDYKDPKTLSDFQLPPLLDHNLFVCDFFADELCDILHGKRFDFIIGNPPWGRVPGLHERYCVQRGLPTQNKEISRSFVYRAKDFSHAQTQCCLIVTSKLFYNRQSSAVEFRGWLLDQTKVDRYIELAAVREHIFDKAKGPAGVVIYRFDDDQKSNADYEMCHLSLKPNVFLKLFNIISIDKSDYKYVPQKMLKEHDWLWKTLVFGNVHDFRLIKRLMAKYPPVQRVLRERSLKHGAGISVNGGDEEDASHLTGRWMIDARKGIRPFEVDMAHAEVFNKETIHRAKGKKPHLFQAPMMLIKKGFDIKSFKFRAAYIEEALVYSDAVRGVCGSENDADKEVLLSLTGLINSSLYAYINLMVGSSSGIEREQCFQSEIMKYPAIIDSQIAELVYNIQETISSERMEILVHPNERTVMLSQLDALILDKFGIAENPFIDYALNVQIPSIAQSHQKLESVTQHQLREYANVFITYFSGIFADTGNYVSASIYPSIAGHFCAVEIAFHDNMPQEEVLECSNATIANHGSFDHMLLKRINDQFYQVKDVISFSEKSFFILKSREHRYWHPAIARLDLSDVLDSILIGSGGLNQ
jgi:type I restriction-modification system DNA methylase subunit